MSADRANMTYTIHDVDALIRVLGQRHHRRSLAAKLFPEADADYVQSWVEPFRFWCRLDDNNKRLAIACAADIL